ncbi:MAG: Hpt domain-containing protein [Clostridia bacterium]|nr:Hpt domain-containing protein [Clostridia bacterium]
MENNAMDILRDAGFDVEGALKRMANNQALYLRLLGRFLQEGSFAKLRDAVEAGDAHGAGECAHALKGMCSQLGMEKLSDHCAKLQYLYQGREEGDPKQVFAQADREYAHAREAVEKALA